MKRLIRAGLVAVLSIWLTTLGRASPIEFTLTPSIITGAPSQELTFRAAIRNTSASDVWLNGVVSSISSSFLVVDDQPFFLNAPSFLASDESFVGEVFDVMIGNTAALGTYLGNFTIQGGGDQNSFDELAAAEFSVVVRSVTLVPEPNTLLLFAGALLFGKGWRRKRRQGR